MTECRRPGYLLAVQYISDCFMSINDTVLARTGANRLRGWSEMASAVIDEVTPAMSAARSITPRRSLPSGRAVVGALLVTVAAVGSFVAATGGESTPDGRYLIAARPIDAGEVVSEADFDVVPIDLPEIVAATTVRNAGNVDGATVLRNLRSGELVSTHDLLAASQAGDGNVVAMHELTFPVPRGRAGQELIPGDRVTVLATLPFDGGSTTFVAVEDAIVVGWATGAEGIGASGSAVLTLALSEPGIVMELVHMTHQGEITVVRTTRAMGDTYPYSYPPASTGRDPVADDLASDEP